MSRSEPLREREGLIARVRQIRRVADATAPTPEPRTEAPTTELEALEHRVAHLEQLLEALQDSVHRESERQGRRITDLEVRTQPSALHVALSREARERGL